MQIQQQIGHLFPFATCTELTQHLKTIGYRFPNIRAQYITETQSQKDHLPTILTTHKGEQLRVWLVKNIKGFGYKEANHFLRNIGYDDYAIIDFHIIDILSNHGYIQKPQTLTKKRYLDIEQVIKTIAQTCDLTLAQLDFYLWYLETGKILK
jgi:N-glycosylase/DNA lyase